MSFLPLLTTILSWLSQANAQSDPRQLQPALSAELQNPQITGFQLRQYAMKRVPPLPLPKTPQQWTTESNRIRKHLLENVIFRGWPKDWVNAPPKFEVVGPVPNTTGYRATKLRYEVVPGFYSAAILYEPENLTGRVPAILNVNGHVGPIGKAVEYKQKRCINFARQGMLALNLEWIAFGELASPENRHSFAAHLDLAGANGVGLFYLAMRKGLDYLEQHQNADRSRLGVTGLSGGGWQTITLSALDERVAVSVPVAGYAALTADIEHPEYVGNDIEQTPTDFRDGQDYAHLTAMRAPRPTLLIYNAEDDCCFRAGIVKSGVFDDIKPWYRLFGRPEAFRWHENTDPGTHNYQLDNRVQAYRFFSEQFRLPLIDHEIPVDAEVKTAEELEVGLPKNNLTLLGVARRLAESITPAPGASPADSQTALTRLIHYRPVKVRHPWATATTKSKGVETHSYVFEFDNGLCATGVLIKAINAPANAPITLVLNDKGKGSASVEVSDYVNRGNQVLAVDLLFFGDNSLVARRVPEYAQLLASLGDRPLALEAAQLLAISSWLQQTTGATRKRIHSTGMRSQLVGLTAAALEPKGFSEVKVQNGIRSLRHLLDAPVPYEDAPDLFCLDLYRQFDVPRLTALAQR